METIRVKALGDFTVFTAGYGCTHGDPNSDDEAVRFPEVPVSHIESLIERGKIEAPEGGADEAPLAGDEAAFTMKYVPVGKYEITGPGLDEPEVVKGKDAAQARLDELNASQKPLTADEAPIN